MPDALGLILRGWMAQDEIASHAWSLTHAVELGPEHAQRVQHAASAGDDDRLLAAVGDLLEAVAQATK
jgi:hypothetical protein